MPVVLLSADAHIEDKTAEAAAEAYLRKPVGLKQLSKWSLKYADG